MILDKTLSGILDQGSGCLEIFEESVADVRVFFLYKFRILTFDRKPMKRL